jgi:cytidylate kinase
VALVVAAGLALGTGLGFVAAGHVFRQQARERWAEVARHVGEPGYDPDESDLRYLDVEAWNDWITLAWRVAATGGAGLLAAIALRRRHSKGKSP